MTNPYHVAVWIDHKEAKIFSVGSDVHFKRVQNPSVDERVHHHAGSVGPGHQHEDAQYLRAVADALASAHEIVIFGPAQAKHELVEWINRHAPSIGDKVIGVETLDRATDGELVAFAKQYFRAKDRLTPQLPS